MTPVAKSDVHTLCRGRSGCYGGLVNTLGQTGLSRPRSLPGARLRSLETDVMGGTGAGRSGCVLTANETRICVVPRGILPALPLPFDRGPTWDCSLRQLEVAGSNPVAPARGRSSVRSERQHLRVSHSLACDQLPINHNRSGSERVGSLRNQGGPSSRLRGLARCEEVLTCFTNRPEDSGGPMATGFLYMTEESGLITSDISGRRTSPARPFRESSLHRTGRRTMVTSLCRSGMSGPAPIAHHLPVRPHYWSGGPTREPVIPGSSPGWRSSAGSSEGEGPLRPTSVVRAPGSPITCPPDR